MSTHSYSALNMLDECPRRYCFRYRERVDVGQANTIESFTGSCVHGALERLYKEVAMGRTPSADDVAGSLAAIWDEDWCDDIAVREGRTAEEYRALADGMVRRFVERKTPFHDGTTIGLELKLLVPLDDAGEFELIGYADRVVRVEEGRWEIHDYKTSSRLPAQADLDADRQLAMYQLAIQRMYPEARDVELVWHYLAFDMEMRSKRTPEQIEELRTETIDRMRAAQTCSEFPTRTSGLCGWCEYRGVCPAFAHERALDAEEPQAAAMDGVALVDRYVELDAAIKAMDREKAEVNELIVAYAAENGYDTVVGTTQQVKVWRRDGACCLPDWDDPRRSDIESILREAGLWDRYSSLATINLSKALEAGALPDDVERRIMQHVRLEPRVRLYVRARQR